MGEGLRHIAEHSTYMEDREKALYWQMTVEWADNCKLYRETVVLYIPAIHLEKYDLIQ